MKTRRPAALLAAFFLAACAGTPGPGDAGYAYNVIGPYTGQFVVDGQALGATLQLETAAGGAVTGTFGVSMMGIRGDIEGMVVGDQLTFAGKYHNPDSGCDGVAEATATIAEDGASIAGRIEVTECGQFLSGTLRFQR